MPTAVTTRTMASDDWREAERRHVARIDSWTADHGRRASRATPHPVEDFLFTYYSLRPGQLRRWHPGVGVALDGPAAQERLAWRGYARVPAMTPDGQVVDAVGVDAGAFRRARAGAVRLVRELLSATAARPAQLGCFGLHEWAMAYRLSEAEQRHAAWPLRLGSAGTDEVVESHRIRCTHADAFRFFTLAAMPLNVVQPQRSTQVEMEQPGCLHATMDLYKWAFKLSPAVPSALLADCFALAREVRALDMRASPYDLTALGYEPVRIEEPQGKAAYVQAQRDFAERAHPLRLQLLEVCERLEAAS